MQIKHKWTDTPENSQVSAITVTWVEEWMAQHAQTEAPAQE